MAGDEPHPTRQFKRHSTMRLFILTLLCLSQVGALAADSRPRVNVTNIRRAFHNREHNAFTDLIRFRDRFYLSFRSCPDGHAVFPTSSVIVLESEDARTWKQVHRFNVPRRDTRDPHLLVFQDKLFVYTGTWHCGDGAPSSPDINQHLGYAVWSRDGREWSAPTMLEGTYGHYIWRAAAHGGKAYLCGRRKREFGDAAKSDRRTVESAMLESDDGLIWRKRALFQETMGNETAFLFEPDGAVFAVARMESDKSLLCRSQPPYVEWKRTELDRYIGGPLVAKWGERYLVGGRKMIDGKNPKTTLYWLHDDQLHELAELPSGGDNSYPGFVALSPTRGLLSWYSSHEKNIDGRTITAIYLADLENVE
jgi:hypothetical protein